MLDDFVKTLAVAARTVDDEDLRRRAVGAWADDPANPGIAAVVCQDEPRGVVTISKRYETTLTAAELDALTAAVLGNAKIAYAQDVARLRRIARRNNETE